MFYPKNFGPAHIGFALPDHNIRNIAGHRGTHRPLAIVLQYGGIGPGCPLTDGKFHPHVLLQII